MLIIIYVILVAGLSDLNRCSLKIQIFYFTWKYFLPLPGKIPGDAHVHSNYIDGCLRQVRAWCAPRSVLYYHILATYAQ